MKSSLHSKADSLDRNSKALLLSTTQKIHLIIVKQFLRAWKAQLVSGEKKKKSNLRYVEMHKLLVVMKIVCQNKSRVIFHDHTRHKKDEAVYFY